VPFVDPVSVTPSADADGVASPNPQQMGPAVLDNPAWHALGGPHRPFAQTHGAARRYHPDVSVFHALPDLPDAQAWADLAALVGPGAELALSGPHLAPPGGWTVIASGEGVQMLAEHLDAAPDEEAVGLTAADVPAMLDLVERTQPGPFRPRTIELGTYLGIRREGRLVAMAGERLHPPGWTEISAVCTDPDFRGQGLAGRLVRAVAHGIADRGERALLHAAATNTHAIRLYEQLGFVLRRRTTFVALRSPGA
jgi:ribosomal protein S18 acetylase RimI-like enzyme